MTTASMYRNERRPVMQSNRFCRLPFARLLEVVIALVLVFATTAPFLWSPPSAFAADGTYAFLYKDGTFLLKQGTDPDPTYGEVEKSWTKVDVSTITKSGNIPWLSGGNKIEDGAKVKRVIVQTGARLNCAWQVFGTFANCETYDLSGLDISGAKKAAMFPSSGSAAAAAKSITIGPKWNPEFDFRYFATNNEDVRDVWYSDDGGATYKTIKNVASAIALLIPKTGSMTFYLRDPDSPPPVELNDCDISISGEGVRQSATADYSIPFTLDGINRPKDDPYSPRTNEAYEKTVTLTKDGEPLDPSGYTIKFEDSNGKVVRPQDPGIYTATFASASAAFTGKKSATIEIRDSLSMDLYEDSELSSKIDASQKVSIGPDKKTVYIVCKKLEEIGSDFAPMGAAWAKSPLRPSPPPNAIDTDCVWISWESNLPELRDNNMTAIYSFDVSPKKNARDVSLKVTLNGGNSIILQADVIAHVGELSLENEASAASLKALKAGGKPVEVRLKYEGDPNMTIDGFVLTGGNPRAATVQKKSYDASTGILTLEVTPLAASPAEFKVRVEASQTDTYSASNKLDLAINVEENGMKLNVGDAVSLSTTQGDVKVSYNGDGQLQCEVKSSTPNGVVDTYPDQNGKTQYVRPRVPGEAVVTFWAEATDASPALGRTDVTFTVADGRTDPPPIGNASYELKVGETSQPFSYEAPLTVHASPAGVVEVMSSNEDKKFVVKALKEGSATVTVSAEATDKHLPLSQTITFTVTAKGTQSLEQMSLTVGETKTLENVELKDAQGNVFAGELEAKSSNAQVALASYSASSKTVSIQAIGAGSAIITLSSDELALDYTMHVTVEAPKAKNVVRMDEITLVEGQRASATLSLKDANGNAVNGAVSAVSSDEGVAKASYNADSGKLEIRALSAGKASITLSSNDLADDYLVPVTVNPAPKAKDHAVIDNDRTGITAKVLLSGENIPGNARTKLVAASVTKGDAYDQIKAKFTRDAIGVFEVKLLVNDQEVHDKFGSIELTFPVDARYNGGKAVVWHRHQDGTVTSEEVAVQDGKAVITVTDLSTFGVEAKASGNQANLGNTGKTGVGLSKTGDDLKSNVLTLAALVLALGAAAVTRLVRGDRPRTVRDRKASEVP